MSTWIEAVKATRQNACNNQEDCILCYFAEVKWLYHPSI